MLEDIDVLETQEWLDSIESLVENEGLERAQFIIEKALQYAKEKHVQVNSLGNTPYINTIPVDDEPEYPGNLALEKRINSIVRWNAIMIILRASAKHLELGGHITTFQGDADMYEVGFNHFFHGKDANHGGDLVFFQGHDEY